MQGKEKAASFIKSAPVGDVPSPIFSKKPTSSSMTATKNSWKVTGTQRICRKVLDHWLYSVWISALTIYALFADDSRLAATSQSADPIFFSISCVVMFIFSLELVVASLVKEEYWLGFYFWLDLLATVSMISDIGWAWESILGTDTAGGNSGVTKSAQLARAARASRAGTRAGRIIRMVRIIRLIRLVKLYKVAQQANADELHHGSLQLFRSYVTYRGDPEAISIPSEERTQIVPNSADTLSVSQSMEMDSHGDKERNSILIGSTRTSAMFEYGRLSGPKQILGAEEILGTESNSNAEPEMPLYEESNVGHRLSEITTKRVILLVLGMMFVMPLFSNSMYVDDNNSFTYALRVLDKASETSSFDAVWDKILNQHKDLFTPVIFIEVLGRNVWQKVSPTDLRSVEQQVVVLDETIGSRYYVSAM